MEMFYVLTLRVCVRSVRKLLECQANTVVYEYGNHPAPWCIYTSMYHDVTITTPWYRHGIFFLGNVWDLTLSVRNSLTETLRVFSSVRLTKSRQGV